MENNRPESVAGGRAFHSYYLFNVARSPYIDIYGFDNKFSILPTVEYLQDSSLPTYFYNALRHIQWHWTCFLQGYKNSYDLGISLGSVTQVADC